MSPSEQVLIAGHGYRISKSASRLIFERPETGSSPLVNWLGLGLSFLAVLLALGLGAQAFASPEERTGLFIAGMTLFGLGTLALFVGRRTLRSTRTAQAKLGPRLFLDQTALRNAQGNILAPRASLRIRTTRQGTDSTGIVSLCWPGAQVFVFKSDDEAEIRQLYQELAEFGLPTQSD
jgi:hypothetical protein